MRKSTSQLPVRSERFAGYASSLYLGLLRLRLNSNDQTVQLDHLQPGNEDGAAAAITRGRSIAAQ